MSLPLAGPGAEAAPRFDGATERRLDRLAQIGPADLAHAETLWQRIASPLGRALLDVGSDAAEPPTNAGANAPSAAPSPGGVSPSG